jgi:hypothetical protein
MNISGFSSRIIHALLRIISTSGGGAGQGSVDPNMISSNAWEGWLWWNARRVKLAP